MVGPGGWRAQLISSIVALALSRSWIALAQAEPPLDGAGDTSCTNSDSAAATALFDWVQQGGAVINGIELRHWSSTERGLVASRDLPEGHAVLEIPPDLIVTAARATESPLGKVLLQAAKDGTLPDGDLDGLLLTVWLLHEARDPDSTWAVYLASIPTDFPTMPLNFTEEALQRCVGGLEIEAYMQRNRRILRTEFEFFSGFGDVFEELTWYEFSRARFVSFSRTFTVSKMALMMHMAIAKGPRTRDIPTQVPLLEAVSGRKADEAAVYVPLADMINHRRGKGASCSWEYDGGGQGFLIKTKRPISAGEELFITYGEKASDILLTHYGFVEVPNPSESLTLNLRIRPGADPAVPLEISGDKPSAGEELLAVLAAFRTAAKREGEEEGAAVIEERALQLLSASLEAEDVLLSTAPGIQDGDSEAVQHAPCVALRTLLRDLLAIWRRWVDAALRFLGGELLDPDEGAEAGKLWLHSRLYFGNWLGQGAKRYARSKESRFVAQEFGRVSYIDLLDDFGSF